MNHYTVVYFLSIIYSIYGWVLILRKYRNTGWLFYFLFTVLASAWFLLYFLFFSGIEDVNLLLLFSRLAYGIGHIGMYYFLLFVIFFEQAPSKLITRKTIAIFLASAGVLAVYVFTDAIIAWLKNVENVYREIPGTYFWLDTVGRFLFAGLFLFFAYSQIKKQTHLNKIRLKNIFLSAFIFILFIIIFQVILPLFWIWVLEKEIVFFFIGFLLSVTYALKRYYFSSLGYGVGKIIVGITSVAFSVLTLNAVEFLYGKMIVSLHGYWAIYNSHGVLDTIIGIFLFLAIHRILSKIFLWETEKLELKKRIQKLEKNVSYITNIKELNKYLRIELRRIFKTSFSQVQIFDQEANSTEIQRYFENKLTDHIFINDVVFIEEKKSKFNKENLLQDIPAEAFIVLPLFNKEGNRNIGIFVVGVKSFWDFYTIDEIDILREFAFFLELHVKFLGTYKQIQDLSVNLDRRVDEKTMEYNDLINKQKEFISTISHEIKSPLANAIFQADGMLDDLENGDLSLEDTKKELELLNAQLIKTGELTNRLFAVQYYDTRSVTLFREKIQVSTLLETEFEVYSHLHREISFINEIDQHIGFIDIDRIQFQQVITNLIGNAVKFLDKEFSTILIGAHKKDGLLHVTIEDNGKWFEGIDIMQLFDKYTTGWGESEGLGMGLYLCKKIIEMHHGSIVAGPSQRFGWARFSITIPA